MGKMNLLKPVAIAVSTALAGGLSLTANADTGPFAMAGLSSGYMVASGTEGAGGEKAAEAEGKCGEGKCGEAMKAKQAEGKCGEGKCGGEKADKAEGKCGGDKE